jgi:N-methylhydantoinase B
MSALDQITLDVLWNRLIATVNEQAAALVRASFTSIVREAGDLSAGVFDRRGRMVAQAVTGTPGHINSMATGMAHFLERFPADALRPGDVLVTNDPWKTASQLNDITVATPVFRGPRLVALFANTCHALDIGGRGLSADARSVFEEGLFVPVMKLHDAGRPVEPLFELIAANVRTPEEVLGDLHSQVVGNEVGARQLLRFLDEFGLPDIEALADEIVARSERAMRERIAALRDGEYHYALTIDGFDRPLEIRAAVRVHGDELTVDFAGSSGPVPLGVNVALNYTRAYTTYGVKCVVSPDVPNNEGSFRPVHVTAPEGSLLNARFPAPVAGRHLVGHFLPSAVMGALAQALPGRVMAPGFDGLWDTHVAGVERGTGRRFSFTWFSAGGTGALRGQDGLSATAYPSGVAGVAVEVIETLAPIVLRRRELRPDSGGPGTFRGGLGQVMEVEVLTDEPYVFSGLYERTRHPAPGLQGGGPGATGRLTPSHGIELPPKVSRVVPPDTVVTLELPGGGGYGPPLARDPERVLEDVREGYVSAEEARAAYGVAVDPVTLTVLEAETATLRAAAAGSTAGPATAPPGP